ncbi:MAG TPA: ABC transporter substrate-binding protein, partial [Xanthobacteraceae bacterium]
MMNFIAPLIVAVATAFGASLGHAEIRIGLAVPLTGSSAWGGVDIKEGTELAATDLNARGGVLGEHIEVVWADDYCYGDQAIAAADKLNAANVAVV